MINAGGWELSGPENQTHKKGGSLDRVVFQSWGDAPEGFLQPESGTDREGEWVAGAAEEFYPSVVVPVRLFGDYHPVILRLPFCPEGHAGQGADQVRRLKLDGLSAEDWLDRDLRIRTEISENKEKFERLAADRNVAHFRNKIT